MVNAAAIVLLAALRGPARPAGHAASGGHHGFLLAVDAGAALREATHGDPSASAGAFSARAGYAFGAASIDLAYDDLGVPLTPGANGSLQMFSIGARYELLSPVIPFAEVRFGPAFHGAATTVAASIGGGLAVPLARALRIQLTARDWLVSAGDSVRPVLSALLGLEVRLR